MAKVKKEEKVPDADMSKKAIQDLREEIAKLAMEHAKGQLKQTTQLRTKKDALARLLTQLNMMKFIEKNTKEEKK